MRKNLDKLLVCALLIIAIRTSAQVELITTVAGNGVSTPFTDNVAATAATMFSPVAVAVDKAGNFYIADKSNNRIRKVTKSTGHITTVAGNGTAGYSGDGFAATAAELSGPTGVAVDTLGNLYIADYSNNSVRKITAAGIISTIAGQGPATAGVGFGGDGGPATAALFKNPVDVAVDAAGNIYVADQNNAIVRKIDPSGNINAFAGTGTYVVGVTSGPATAAGLGIPVAIRLDASANLYIADQGNNVVYKVSSGMMAAVAGTGTAGYSGDGGTALGAEVRNPSGVEVDCSGNIYISDAGNQVVRKVTAATGDMSTYVSSDTAIAGFRGDGGPATGAELRTPQGLGIDTAGNLYIADESNQRIRKVYVKNTTGLPQIVSQNSNITLFPNPNNGTFTIKGSLNIINDEKVSLSVINMLGKVVYENSLMVHNGTINNQVSLQNNLPEGEYLLDIRSGTKSELAKIVLQR